MASGKSGCLFERACGAILTQPVGAAEWQLEDSDRPAHEEMRAMKRQRGDVYESARCDVTDHDGPSITQVADFAAASFGSLVEALQRQAPAAPLSVETKRSVVDWLAIFKGRGRHALPVFAARLQNEIDVELARRAYLIREKVDRVSCVKIAQDAIPARGASDGEIAGWLRSIARGFEVNLFYLAAQLLAPTLAQGQNAAADLDMLYDLIRNRLSNYPRPKFRSDADDTFNKMVRKLKTAGVKTKYSEGGDDKLFQFAALSDTKAAEQAAKIVKECGAPEHLAKEVALAAGARVSELLDERLEVLGAEFDRAPSDEALKKIREEIDDASDCIIFNYHANRELNEAVYLLDRLDAKYHCKGLDMVIRIIKTTQARSVRPVGEWLLPVKSCVYYRDMDVFGTEYVKRVVKEMGL